MQCETAAFQAPAPYLVTSQNHPWFAVRVKSNREQVVSTVLRAKGYEEFLPVYRTRRRWTDRVRERTLPLFPGYVFCRLDLSFRGPVVTIPSVVGIIGIGKQPVPIDEQEVAALQALQKTSLFAQAWPFLQAGQKVRIEEGSLKGVEGILLHCRGQYRLVLSVSILQRSVAVEVDRNWIRPV